MKKTSANLLNNLFAVISQLNNSDYSSELAVLNHNSVGKHVRHILDMFECLIDSTTNGILNYDNRKRFPKTETDKNSASEKVNQIIEKIESIDLSKPLILQQKLANQEIQFQTSVQRELLYNIEHCVHHLAIIRIGIEQDFPHIEIPENFGIAYSTLQQSEKYQT